jgi:hypothetical protein
VRRGIFLDDTPLIWLEPEAFSLNDFHDHLRAYRAKWGEDPKTIIIDRDTRGAYYCEMIARRGYIETMSPYHLLTFCGIPILTHNRVPPGTLLMVPLPPAQVIARWETARSPLSIRVPVERRPRYTDVTPDTPFDMWGDATYELVEIP